MPQSFHCSACDRVVGADQYGMSAVNELLTDTSVQTFGKVAIDLQKKPQSLMKGRELPNAGVFFVCKECLNASA